jgi:hypothetical protein
VLLLPLTDVQFESAVEAREIRVAAILVPEEARAGYVGVLRLRHAGMLTHWAEIRAVDRQGESSAGVLVRIGPLQRFPRPLEWREQRELYRPVRVEVEALRRAQVLDEVVDTDKAAAQKAITQAIDFIQVEAPRLDLSKVDRKHLLDRAAGFAAKDPKTALAQIDDAVTEALRDVAASYYGEAAETDGQRDGWFGSDKVLPSVDAYLELLRQAEDRDLKPLLERIERYLVVRTRAGSLEGPLRPIQVVDLIAVAQAILDSTAGQ